MEPPDDPRSSEWLCRKLLLHKICQNIHSSCLAGPRTTYMYIMWLTSFVCLTLDCYVCHTLYAIHCSSDKHLEPKNYTDRIQRGLIKLNRCWMDMRPSTVSLDRVVTTCHTHCIYLFLLHRSQVGMDGRPSTEKQTIHFTCGLRLRVLPACAYFK